MVIRRHGDEVIVEGYVDLTSTHFIKNTEIAVVLILFIRLHRASKTNRMKRYTALFQVRFPGQPNSRPAYLNQMTHLFHLV